MTNKKIKSGDFISMQIDATVYIHGFYALLFVQMGYKITILVVFTEKLVFSRYGDRI